MYLWHFSIYKKGKKQSQQMEHMFTEHFAEQSGSSDKTCDLNSEDARFESRTRTKTTLTVRIFYGYPQSFQANCGILT
jgi:hypothetical protein